MLENISGAFRDFIIILQLAKLYSVEHAKFLKFLDATHASLSAALEQYPELVFGIVGEELAFEKEILFELSRSVRPMILYLKQRGIERIAFKRGLRKQELRDFIAFLMRPKEEFARDPQEALAGLGVLAIEAGRLRNDGQSGSSDIAEAVNYLSVYASSLDTFTQSFQAIVDGKQLDPINLRFNVTTLMETLLSRHQELLKLTVLKRYDVGTFVHQMNVSILSMFFASRLGLAQENLVEIGIAGLFHDIGKMSVSRKIITKTTGLTQEELDRMQSHSLLGARMLLAHADTLGYLPVVVAFEHHVKADARSYPRRAFERRPSLGSTIVSICDIYDALFQRRSYKASYPVNVIYEIMMKEKPKFYEPKLVDAFFKVVGVWPVGTIVALSDNRLAIVRHANERDKFAPVVEVVHPADQREMIDLHERAGEISIVRSLDPANDGKEYLQFV